MSGKEREKSKKKKKKPEKQGRDAETSLSRDKTSGKLREGRALALFFPSYYKTYSFLLQNERVSKYIHRPDARELGGVEGGQRYVHHLPPSHRVVLSWRN